MPRIEPGVVAEARRLITEEGYSRRGAAALLGVSESGLRGRLPQEDTGRPPFDVTTEEVPVFVRDYSSQPAHRIYPLGDVHVGSPAHAADRWQQWLDYLGDADDVSMLGTGDFLDSALKDSKSEAYDATSPLWEAKRQVRRQLQPLAEAGRLDGLCPGNHEDRCYRATGDCPVRDIADVLEVPYFRGAALFVYHVGDQTYEVFMRHGTGNGQSMAQLVKGAMVYPTADVQVQGHTHNQAVRADEYFSRDGGKVVRSRRYYVASGSFVGYERYAQERGYVPTRIGAPRIHLDGRAHDVHVSV